MNKHRIKWEYLKKQMIMTRGTSLMQQFDLLS